VSATAHCLDLKVDYTLECKTRAQYTTKDGYAGCEHGYEMMSCNTWTTTNSLDDYHLDSNGKCYVQQDNWANMYANAICCQLRGPADAVDPNKPKPLWDGCGSHTKEDGCKAEGTPNDCGKPLNHYGARISTVITVDSCECRKQCEETDGCGAWTWIGPLNYSPWDKNTCILRKAVADGDESFTDAHMASSFQRSDNMIDPVGPTEPACVWKSGYPAIGSMDLFVDDDGDDDEEEFVLSHRYHLNVDYLNDVDANTVWMAFGLLCAAFLVLVYKLYSDENDKLKNGEYISLI